MRHPPVHASRSLKPMGVAVPARPEGTRYGAKLAIGGQKAVWDLHNMPAVARKLNPHTRWQKGGGQTQRRSEQEAPGRET